VDDINMVIDYQK